MNEPDSPQRKTHEPENLQPSLLGDEFETPTWREHWWGMPSYVMGDARPMFQITVNFFTLDDVMEFAQRLDLKITKRTDSVWFPPDEVERPSEWEFTD